MAPAAFLNTTCVSLLSSDLTSNPAGSSTAPLDFHDCVVPLPPLDTTYWKRWIVGAVVITFVVMLILSCTCYSSAKSSLLYRLQVLDSYNLHREVEDVWVKNQVHGKQALIRYYQDPDGTLPYKESPRYLSITYKTYRERGKRTIIITEDLRRGPSEKDKKTWRRGLVSRVRAVQLQPGNRLGYTAVQQEALNGQDTSPTAQAVGNDVEMAKVVRAPEPTARRMPGEWRESVPQ